MSGGSGGRGFKCAVVFGKIPEDTAFDDQCQKQGRCGDSFSEDSFGFDIEQARVDVKLKVLRVIPIEANSFRLNKDK